MELVPLISLHDDDISGMMCIFDAIKRAASPFYEFDAYSLMKDTSYWPTGTSQFCTLQLFLGSSPFRLALMYE